MSHDIWQLFENNRRWAEEIKSRQPDFFTILSKQQVPAYLWIGCADSRVPANEIVGLMPGEVFVHRNVANIVTHTDFNCLSVIQFAVDVLKVEHVIVTGHYGCGGVVAAMKPDDLGLITNWLRHIRDIYLRHRDEVDAFPTEAERVNRLCELNVREQVRNVCQTTIVQAAWKRGQKLAVHGWIYGLADGLLRDLNVTQTE
ncbi:MAG TPA: carbonate dehydratase [Chthoniobacteraceae bacterium]|nr:carbonate dehydratase [Chthoniobacteraceae bacterium]